MKHGAKLNISKRFFSVFLLIIMTLSLFTLAVQAEGEGESNPEESNICELKIRYVTQVFSDDEMHMSYVDIASTYHVTIPYGEEYSEVSPEVENYALVNEADAVISGIATEANKEILVIYKESIETAKYTVNYWKQDQDGQHLEKLENLCYEDVGNVGTSVTVKLPSVPGYSWSNDDLLVYITADGKAVKNVYYVKSEKRKLVFRTGTGYAKYIEAYPGDDITAERAAIRDVDPEKPGYKFVNWDKSIAELGEQVLYNEDNTIYKKYNCYEVIDGVDHYYMPADDYIINAIWAKAVTPYRVVFWFEKANGTGYTNGGIDETRYALADTEVTAAYYDRLIVDEKTLFNADFTEIKDITVDDAGNPYNFAEHYSEPAKDAEGNVLKDANGNPVVIEYTNTYDNPQGTSYADYKAMPFFGFDYDHCNKVTVTADGNATLNVYYKRETWTVKIYKKPSTSNGNTTWRTISGRYCSVVPMGGTADDVNTIPAKQVAENYYNNNKPTGTTDDFYDLRTTSNTIFNLETQQVFNTEDGNGLHVYSVYPLYATSTGTKSKRMFYGANLTVSPDNSQNLDADYGIFATSSGSTFSGTIQPAFIFDEARQRKYTWEGAKFRYQACEVGTDINDGAWSNWKKVDTTTKPSNNADITDTIYVGEATVFLRKDGVAYWYFNNPKIQVGTTTQYKYDFYLQVILPRKKLDLKYVSHNEVVKTEQVECGAPLADYYTYAPADTTTERFVGWYEDAEMTQPVDTAAVMGYADDNIYAKWESKQCIVSFDPRNGEDTIEVLCNYGGTFDSSAMPADPEKEGFRFVGWYTEEDSHFSIEEELGGDLPLHAVWEPIELSKYTVRHILQRADNTEELILETIGYDSKHKTVKVTALTNEQKPVLCVRNLYVVHDGSNSSSQSIDLSLDEEHIAIFYYKEMTEWDYTITYRDIDNPTKMLQSDLTKSTDLITITLKAPTITTTDEGEEKVWVPVKAIGQRLPNALKSAKLVVGGNNIIPIYYDELHTLTFELNDGTNTNPYPSRSLIKKEKTSVPQAPQLDGHIFLSWNTDKDGLGDTYYPGDTLEMPDDDLTLYAQWATADAIITQGRLLDRISADDNEYYTVSNENVSISVDGSATALFSLEEDNRANENIKRINPNELKLFTDSSFKAGTVITLIVYPNNGSHSASFYYYKAKSDASYVALTDFVEMGSSNVKFTSASKVKDFYCQVCIDYPSGVSGSNTICLSPYSNTESATRLGINIANQMKQPQGGLSVTENTATAGKLNTDLTVDLNLSDFKANQSDCRHTNKKLSDYEPVVTITLKDKNKNTVPFPENSTFSVNGTQIKSTGEIDVMLKYKVTNGAFAITATGLPNEELFVYFKLCAADNDSASAIGHPMNHPVYVGNDSENDEDVFVKLNYEPEVKYAIHAELAGGDINRVFASPAENKALTFDITYQAKNSDALPLVTAFAKQNNVYTQITDFTTNISYSEGKATAIITVPANTASGTYRLKFSVGTAEYNYNLIITED